MSSGMGRRSKKDRCTSVAQAVLAENVEILRDVTFSHLDNVTERNKALATRADTVLATIQRIIKLEVAAGVDMVERLALALNVRPQDLLTPDFARRAVSTIPAAEVPALVKPAATVHEPTANYPKAAPTRSPRPKT